MGPRAGGEGTGRPQCVTWSSGLEAARCLHGTALRQTPTQGGCLEPQPAQESTVTCGVSAQRVAKGQFPGAGTG